MNVRKIIGIILLAAGLLILVYGGFSYTKKTRGVKLGSVSLEYKQKERVNVPTWIGVACVVAGGGVLAMGGRKKA
jgi:uncharacterized membrane protein YdcZ (DUF606 family)